MNGTDVRSIVCASAILALWSLGFCAAATQADIVDDSVGGFQLSIAANRDMLEYPHNEMVAMMASWDSPNGLMMARNHPFIQIDNTSDTANISVITLEMGLDDFFFDFVDMIEMSEGVGMIVDLHEPDGLDDGTGTGLIHLEFANFTPGSFVRFRTQIQPYSQQVFQFPDFRDTLFQLNGSDTSDNAVASVAFTNEGGDGSQELVVSAPLENFDSPHPTVMNFGYRPYGDMDMLEIFAMDGAGEFPVVPEPGTAVLMWTGLLGLLAVRRRKWSL